MNAIPGPILLLGAESVLGLAVSARLGTAPRFALGGTSPQHLAAPAAEVARVRALGGVASSPIVLVGDPEALVAEAARELGGLTTIVAVGTGGAWALPELFEPVLATAPARCSVVAVGEGDGHGLAMWTEEQAPRLAETRHVRLNAVSVMGGDRLGWSAWGGTNGQAALVYAEAARVVRLLLARDAQALVGQTIHVNAALRNPMAA